jgi:hypothetical protein
MLPCALDPELYLLTTWSLPLAMAVACQENLFKWECKKWLKIYCYRVRYFEGAMAVVEEVPSRDK